MHITTLNLDDFESFREIRLLALKNDPMSFGSSYEEEVKKSDEYFKNRIKATDNKFMLGSFDCGRLINIASFTREIGLKEQHKGELPQYIVCQIIETEDIQRN